MKHGFFNRRDRREHKEFVSGFALFVLFVVHLPFAPFPPSFHSRRRRTLTRQVGATRAARKVCPRQTFRITVI
jgi:hypothetical protein